MKFSHIGFFCRPENGRWAVQIQKIAIREGVAVDLV